MKYIISLIVTINIAFANIYDFNVTTIDGNNTSMQKYKNRVILIVNTASKCGFVNQFKGLEKLYQKYKDQGLSVLGFPSNGFKNQEPKTNKGIKNFCEANYNVSFDLFSKIEVNGKNIHPMYTYLKDEARGFLGSKRVKWNFTKFLVRSNGQIYDRYSPYTKPKSLEEDIEMLLNEINTTH
ncbi:MAG: Glutathione peroxidase family protein [uncultured Campylobacterales bacterium]|uniref:Glutathione peroxidase n=1 Tax=uncultured Campylobacterales bacterium TaxID=352960 RepID=A0A6S6SX33_9BACT|nr:MAG: Glutathione peroxidase family protein [uncultured Campylobacterales bacterium]